MCPVSDQHLMKSRDSNSADIAARYLDFLLEARRRDAFDVVLREVGAGMPVTSVYVDVLQPVMYEVGRLWQTDAIDIATEHYVTAATQLLLAQLFPQVLGQPRISHSMVGCCLGSELHELGMRMVCDFFEFKGWDTYFIGAITPADTLLDVVRSRRPDLICFSATMPFGVPQIRDCILAIKDSMGIHSPKIMVGGLPFLINPDLSKIIGADATASDARSAVHKAGQIISKDSHAEKN
jgi:methanogenic corrinoid protein MtbC1